MKIRSSLLYIVIVSLVVAQLAFPSNRAVACSCADLPFNQRFQDADAVFLGQVSPSDAQFSGTPPTRLVFQVSEVWKGPIQSRISLGADNGCGWNPQPGKLYIVYAYDNNGILSVNGCSTKSLENAQDDLNQLGEGVIPPTNRITAQTPTSIFFAGMCSLATFAILIGLVLIVQRRLSKQ